MSIIVAWVNFLGSWALKTRGFIIGTKYKKKVIIWTLCISLDIIFRCFNEIRNLLKLARIILLSLFIYMLLTFKLLILFRKPVALLCDILMLYL